MAATPESESDRLLLTLGLATLLHSPQVVGPCVCCRRIAADAPVDPLNARTTRVTTAMPGKMTDLRCFIETAARGKEVFRQRLGSGDDVFYLGAFDDSLIGIVGFYREEGIKNRHKGYVVSMYVLPERRGQGVGKALVQELIARARQIDGLEQLLLAVVTTNRTASLLYRSLGFEIYGTQPGALKVGESYWDEDLMILRLH